MHHPESPRAPQIMIFLSHNTRDKPLVEEFARALRQLGLSPWLDKWNIHSGLRFQPLLHEAIGASCAMLVFVGRYGPGFWQSNEVELAIQKQSEDPDYRVMPIVLQGGSLSDWSFLSLRSGVPVDLPSEPPLDDAERHEWILSIRELAKEVKRRLGSKLGKHTDEKTNVKPYRGLLHFDVADAAWMFGRDRDVLDLLARLRAPERFLCLYGPSGSGKSSLVRAGLIPAILTGQLDERYTWQHVVMKPGSSPCEALARHLLQLSTRHQELTQGRVVTEIGDLTRALLENPSALRLTSNTYLKTAEESRLLIVVDQFEEIFTASSPDTDDTALRLGADGQAFIAALFDACDAKDSGVFVVISLRSDFLHLALLEPMLAVRLKDTLRVVLPPMTRGQLDDAITQPAARFDVKVESSVRDALLDATVRQAGQLPLLQLTLSELWEHRTESRLSYASYVELGRIEGVITKVADNVFRPLSREQQEAAMYVLGRLVYIGAQTEDTRRRAKRSEVVDTHDQKIALDALTAGRLVIQSEDYVEIAHEILIRQWPRLREFVDKRRPLIPLELELADSSQRWQSHEHETSKANAELWSGARLEHALAMSQRGDLDLRGAEHDFLRASVRQARRTRLRKRLLLGVLVLTLAGMMVSWWIANTRAHVANFYYRQAKSSDRKATVDRLVMISKGQLKEGNAARAFLIALEATRMQPKKDIGRRSPSFEALHQARLALNMPIIVPTKFESRARFSPDAKHLITSSRRNHQVWKLDTGDGKPSALISGDGALGVSFSAEGSHWVRWNGSPIARVHEAGVVSTGVVIDTHLTAVRDIQIGEDLSFLVTAKQGSSIFRKDGTQVASLPSRGSFAGSGRYVVVPGPPPTVWDSSSGEQLKLDGLNEQQMHDVEISPRGDLAVAASPIGIVVWDLRSGVSRTIKQQVDGLKSAHFSPDGSMFLTVSGGRAQIWNALEGSPVVLGASDVKEASFSPGSTTVLTMGSDGLITWKVTGEKIARYRGQRKGKLKTAYFSPDGHYVVGRMLDKGGSVTVWDVGNARAPWNIMADDQYVVEDIGFGPTGPRLAVRGLSDPYEIQIHDVGNTEPLTLKTHGTRTRTATFSTRGNIVATVDYEGVARVWQTNGHGLPSDIRGHEESIRTASFSPDGKWLVTASNDQAALVWTVPKWKEPRELRGHEMALTDARFSPDSRRVLTASNDRTVRIWDVNREDIPLPQVLVGHTGPVVTASFDTAGNHVVTGSWDKTARVWSMNGEAWSSVALQHDDTVIWAAMDTETGIVATRTRAGEAWLWPAGEPDSPLALHAEGYRVESAMLGTHSQIAVASSDGAIRLWTLADPAAPPTVLGGANTARVVSFSLDGNLVVTGHEDGAVRAWDTTTSQSLLVLESGGPAIDITAVDSKGHLLFTAGRNGSLNLWHMDPNWLIRTGCDFVERNLTCAEWKTYMPTDAPYRRTCGQWPASEDPLCRDSNAR